MVLCEGWEGVKVVFAVVFEEIEEIVIFRCSGGRGGRSFLPDSIAKLSPSPSPIPSLGLR